jgi:hypothetical protein
MKRVLTIFVLAFCFADCSADSPKPIRTIDLSAVATKASECDGRRVVFPNRALWIDDEHLVVWLISTCVSHDVQKQKSVHELVFIGSEGGTQVLQPADVSGFSHGPANTVLVGHGATVDVMQPNLRIKQSIQCPEIKPCAIYPSPSGSSESDFAICSTTKPTEHCVFYKGLPAERLPQAIDLPMDNRAIPTDPYPNIANAESIPTSPYSRTAWRVSENERWFFDVHGALTSLSASRSTALVSSEQWCPKNSNCTGDVSVSKPRRFLATCVGAHFYTDGDLDSIFGYSRIALFDVTSKRMLFRLDGPAYTSATLSPEGRLIATIHRGRKIEVRLYRVD